MSPIQMSPLPGGALLETYRGGGAYTDCYALDLPAVVSLEQYVAAFYTTPVFRLERLILRWLVRMPSTDDQARALAAGATDRFAAWRVEARTDYQLLLCDFRGRTRSWLMVAGRGSPTDTRLYFGSAVVPARDAATGRPRLGFAFRALLGFHKIYSQVLLRAAARRLAGAASSRSR